MDKVQDVVMQFALLAVAAMVVLAAIGAPPSRFVGPLLILAIFGFSKWHAAGRDDQPRH